MKAIHILILALALIAAPALAVNSYDHAQPYTSKYAEPDLDANELQSLSTGALYISITTAGCLDADARTVTIAAYEGDYFQEIIVGPNGKTDMRLEPGRYLIRIAKGVGSANDANTWKAEEQTATVTAGARTDVTFMGAGGRCGLSTAEEPEAEPECPQVSDEELVDGFYEKNRWIKFTLENLNDFPMFVTVKYKVFYMSGTKHWCTPGTTCHTYFTWEPITYQTRNRFLAWEGPSSQYAFVQYRQYHKDEHIEYVTVTGCQKICWGENSPEL